MEPELTAVLVVDDEAASRTVLCHYLHSRGLDAVPAEDGEQGLAALRGRRFDLVLLDVNMPGLSGLDVLQQIRGRYRTLADLPVIMVTSNNQPEDIVAALERGANDYVARPVHYPVLWARIQTQLALRRSTASLLLANRRMERELRIAARVQAALLPRPLPSFANVTFAWRYQPCTELAGDLLNVVPLDDRFVVLYVLDVVGHGVAAALLAVMVHRAIGRLTGSPAVGITPPVEVATRLNEEFPFDERTEQYFTLLYGVLDLDDGSFRFTTAGHPPPVHVPAEGDARPLKASGRPVGMVEADDPLEEHVLAMRSGDRLYLYTDGLTDERNPARRAFGTPRLAAALAGRRAGGLADGLDQLMAEVAAWRGPGDPQDDISVLAVELA